MKHSPIIVGGKWAREGRYTTFVGRHALFIRTVSFTDGFDCLVRTGEETYAWIHKEDCLPVEEHATNSNQAFRLKSYDDL